MDQVLAGSALRIYNSASVEELPVVGKMSERHLKLCSYKIILVELMLLTNQSF